MLMTVDHMLRTKKIRNVCFHSETITLERGLKRADKKLLSIAMELKENKGLFKQITQSVVHVDNPPN